MILIKKVLLIFVVFFIYATSAYAEYFGTDTNGNPTTIYYADKPIKYAMVNGDIVGDIKIRFYSKTGENLKINGPGQIGKFYAELLNLNGSYSFSPSVGGPQYCNSEIPDSIKRYGISFEINGSINSPVYLAEIYFCDGSYETFEQSPLQPDDPPDGGGGTNPPPSAGGNLPNPPPYDLVDDTRQGNACGGAKWANPLRNWVDNIFCPIITFLDLAKQKLDDVSLVTAQGLNIGKYLSVFGDLPSSWQLVLSSLLLMITTLSGLLIFRSAMRLYYAIKEGVKWW